MLMSTASTAMRIAMTFLFVFILIELASETRGCRQVRVAECLAHFVVIVVASFTGVVEHCLRDDRISEHVTDFEVGCHESPFVVVFHLGIRIFRNCKRESRSSAKPDASIVPVGGVRKLKNDSVCTSLVTTRMVPRFLCFCLFFTIFTVTFLPFFQSIVQPFDLTISGPSYTDGSCSSGPSYTDGSCSSGPVRSS